MGGGGGVFLDRVLRIRYWLLLVSGRNMIKCMQLSVLYLCAIVLSYTCVHMSKLSCKRARPGSRDVNGREIVASSILQHI